ncbi:MAG: tetratricopeptide repeat protein [Bacteroidales bacterium]|nr:tetratricopeptide repeat protein [Bacteroidales bacterium]
MAKQNVNDKEALRRENIEETVSKTDQFYNENKKTIWTVVAIVAVVALAVFAYVKLIYQPKCEEAMQQAYPAERSFGDGQYEIALNGDGNILGLADIIAEYGSKAGSAIFMEAGICALHLEQYEDALGYLKKYNGKEPILAARALAAQGDAHAALGQNEEAVAAYLKAARKSDDNFAAGYLLKAGIISEELGLKDKALEYYKTIKDKYPSSVEGYDIDKYITRAE